MHVGCKALLHDFPGRPAVSWDRVHLRSHAGSLKRELVAHAMQLSMSLPFASETRQELARLYSSEMFLDMRCRTTELHGNKAVEDVLKACVDGRREALIRVYSTEVCLRVDVHVRGVMWSADDTWLHCQGGSSHAPGLSQSPPCPPLHMCGVAGRTSLLHVRNTALAWCYRNGVAAPRDKGCELRLFVAAAVGDRAVHHVMLSEVCVCTWDLNDLRGHFPFVETCSAATGLDSLEWCRSRALHVYVAFVPQSITVIPHAADALHCPISSGTVRILSSAVTLDTTPQLVSCVAVSSDSLSDDTPPSGTKEYDEPLHRPVPPSHELSTGVSRSEGMSRSATVAVESLFQHLESIERRSSEDRAPSRPVAQCNSADAAKVITEPASTSCRFYVVGRRRKRMPHRCPSPTGK